MSRTVYLIDEDPLNRRMMAVELVNLGRDPWPFPGTGEFLAMFPHLAAAPVLLIGHAASMRGLASLAQVAKRVPWPVLLMGEQGDFRTAYDALKLGALDFVPRPVDPMVLEDALLASDATLALQLETAGVQRDTDERLSRLTARELEVGLALIRGMSNKTVAHHLGISVRTVEMHRANLLAKLGVRNLAEGAVFLAQYADAQRPAAP